MNIIHSCFDKIVKSHLVLALSLEKAFYNGVLVDIIIAKSAYFMGFEETFI